MRQSTMRLSIGNKYSVKCGTCLKNCLFMEGPIKFRMCNWNVLKYQFLMAVTGCSVTCSV